MELVRSNDLTRTPGIAMMPKWVGPVVAAGWLVATLLRAQLPAAQQVELSGHSHRLALPRTRRRSMLSRFAGEALSLA
jgi:hypothetical protein